MGAFLALSHVQAFHNIISRSLHLAPLPSRATVAVLPCGSTSGTIQPTQTSQHQQPTWFLGFTLASPSTVTFLMALPTFSRGLQKLPAGHII